VYVKITIPFFLFNGEVFPYQQLESVSLSLIDIMRVSVTYCYWNARQFLLLLTNCICEQVIIEHNDSFLGNDLKAAMLCSRYYKRGIYTIVFFIVWKSSSEYRMDGCIKKWRENIKNEAILTSY